MFHSTDRLFGTTNEVFHVVECRGCGLIRLNPQPSPNVLHQYYPESYWFNPDQTNTGQLEQLYRRFVMLDKLLFVERAVLDSEQAGLILDVGCGGGLFLELLAERGHTASAGKLLGLDFSLDAAGAAWRRAHIPALCGTLTSAPLPAGSCAAITMFHVLEHLYDPASYLHAAHGLLAPDGRLVVQVPNAACWQFLLFGERWNGIDVPRHLIDFRASDLDKLLDTCGFEVLRHKHFSMRDNPAGMATSIAPRLDPMARKLRRVRESEGQRFWKNVAYLGLTVASIPFTLLEAVCHAGSTIMVEARKKS
ncbi:MAG: class I SAM-dependent methyltransferase [Acidobacteriota bacterium]